MICCIRRLVLKGAEPRVIDELLADDWQTDDCSEPTVIGQEDQ